MENRSFDTYESCAKFDEFTKTQFRHQGYIVVAACKDDMTSHLSLEGKQWFADMGSTEVWNLEHRSSFTFIGTTGGGDVNERRGITTKDTASVAQVFHVDPDLAAL